MDPEFIVPLKNSWDVHSFAYVNPEKMFVVLADSVRGPVIIESGNMLATMFTTDYKYPNTLEPIKNYILHTLKYIKSQANSQSVSIQAMTLGQARNRNQDAVTPKPKSQNRTLELMRQRQEKMGFSQQLGKIEDPYAEDFPHVGFSAKKEHLRKFYSQNAIGSNRITAHTAASAAPQSQRDQIPFSLASINRDFSRNAPNNRLLDKVSTANSGDGLARSLKNSQASLFNGNARPKNFSSFTGNTPSHDPLDEIAMTQGGIRKMLHPDINNECLEFKKLWVTRTPLCAKLRWGGGGGSDIAE